MEPLDCIKSQPVFQQNTIQLKVLNERRGRVSVSNRRGGRVSVSNRRGDLISGKFSGFSYFLGLMAPGGSGTLLEPKMCQKWP